MPGASFNWNSVPMATKTSPLDEMTEFGGNDAELDQAIDDLRGILKQDHTGADAPADGLGAFGGGADFGGDFGADFAGSGFGGGHDADAAPAMGGFEPASRSPGSALDSNLGLIMDIPIDVQIVLGASRMPVSALMGLSEGATIALDRRIGEPVEIVVNGRVIGRGEITVLEEDETRFGVKLIEIKGSGKA
ncbi:flagellar motor switch protein FliN [Ensifer soli]|uniref:flagellar motor switch protein FliN n=1 Tax=Ciceribacter sp. sgz301302 TaxID=3342379 RepID=UPI0035B9B546